MKKILFFFLFISAKVFAQQPLTIDETITYLNKLSSEHPGVVTRRAIGNGIGGPVDRFDDCKDEVFYEINYDYKEKIRIIETRKVSNCTKQKNFIFSSLYTIDLLSFDEEASFYDFENNRVTKGGYMYLSTDNLDISGDIERTFIDSSTKKYTKYPMNQGIEITIKNKGYLEVYYHGLKYLISLIKQNVIKNNYDIKDPFVTTKSESKSNAVNPEIKKGNVKSESNVPLIEKNGVVYLTITLGEKLLSKFILDSGAGECNISSDLEKKLIDNGIIKRADYLPNGLYRLADGSIVENKRVRVSKIKIGNRMVSNVTMSIGSSDSPNLLGQSLLKKLDKWSIDNAKKILIIH